MGRHHVSVSLWRIGLDARIRIFCLVSKIVGLTRAKELLQLGNEFSARKALDIGLATEVVPKADVLSKAMAVAKRLASMPQFALLQSKRLMNRELAESIDQITEDELTTIKKAISDPETVKAMMSVRKKTAKSEPKSKL